MNVASEEEHSPATHRSKSIMLPLFSVYVHAHAWEGIQVHVCALESGGQSVPGALATYSLFEGLPLTQNSPVRLVCLASMP